MFHIYKQDGETVYGIKEYLLDSVEDLPKISTAKLGVGSTATIIPSFETYILNGQKKWVLVGSGGSSGGDTPDTDDFDNELIEF